MKWLPLVLILLVATPWGWWRHRHQVALQQEIERLRRQAEDATARTSQNRDASAAMAIDTNQFARLQADHRELLRLRGEMGGLRERGRLTRENLEMKIEQAHAETQAVQREIELVHARQQAARVSKHMANVARGYADVAKDLATISNSPLPKSWDEARQYLERPFQTTEKRSAERAERIRASFRIWFEESAARPEHPLDSFELLPVMETLDWKQRDVGRGILMLRERQPRPQPDGGWARAYAFVNGEVRVAVSNTPDFTEWEETVRAEASRAKPSPK